MNKKIFGGLNFVQKFGTSYKKRRLSENTSDKLTVTLEDIQEAAIDFPNSKQCSRLAVTNTALSNWHIYASHLDQVILE